MRAGHAILVGTVLLAAACESTLVPPADVSCKVSVSPSSGSLVTEFATAISSQGGATCTYSLDGRGTIPVQCNTTLMTPGTEQGLGAHTVQVVATAANGKTATCAASWTVTQSGPVDMAGSPPVDMSGAPPVDMSGAAPPDMTASGGAMDMTTVGGPPDLIGAPTELDLHDAILFNNPPNLADWPVTTRITEVDFQYMGQDGVHVVFDKQDGANRWPDVTPPGWTGPLQYTLGMAEYINGQWYASAAIQFWYGLPASGGNVAQDAVSLGPCEAYGYGSTCQVAKNWYYDGRWGNLAGYQPRTGELIGIFVVAGNVRGVTDGSQSPVMERSNVVLMAFPDVTGASYYFQ